MTETDFLKYEILSRMGMICHKRKNGRLSEVAEDLLKFEHSIYYDLIKRLSSVQKELNQETDVQTPIRDCNNVFACEGDIIEREQLGVKHYGILTFREYTRQYALKTEDGGYLELRGNLKVVGNIKHNTISDFGINVFDTTRVECRLPHRINRKMW